MEITKTKVFVIIVIMLTYYERLITCRIVSANIHRLYYSGKDKIISFEKTYTWLLKLSKVLFKHFQMGSSFGD